MPTVDFIGYKAYQHINIFKAFISERAHALYLLWNFDIVEIKVEIFLKLRHWFCEKEPFAIDISRLTLFYIFSTRWMTDAYCQALLMWKNSALNSNLILAFYASSNTSALRSDLFCLIEGKETDILHFEFLYMYLLEIRISMHSNLTLIKELF